MNFLLGTLLSALAVLGGGLANLARAASAVALPPAGMQSASLPPASSFGAFCPAEQVVDYDPLHPRRPRDDPFYVAPEGFASCPNGYVLRSRKIIATYILPGVYSTWTTTVLGQVLNTVDILKILGPLPDRLQLNAYQVLYKTTDGQGRPDVTVATVVVPGGNTYATGRPVVAYQMAEDSVTTDCAPSYILQTGVLGALQNGGKLSPGTFEIAVALLYLLKGDAVVFADHEGMQSKWIAGRNAGHAVLDGIKATLNYQHYDAAKDQVRPTSKVGLIGYSGGAGATTWAVELANDYAPELKSNLVGAAIGASPNVDLRPIITANDGGIAAGVVAMAIVGLNRDDPGAGIDSYMTDGGWFNGHAMLAQFEDGCLLEGAFLKGILYPPLITAGYSLQKFTQNPFLPAADSDPGRRLIAENSVLNEPDRKGRMPVLYYHDQLDGLVPVEPDDRLIRKYCKADPSSPVQVIRLITTGLPDAIPGISIPPPFNIPGKAAGILTHVTGQIAGFVPGFLYISDRFDGVQADNDCAQIPAGNLGWQWVRIGEVPVLGTPIYGWKWMRAPWEPDALGLRTPYRFPL